MIFFQSAFSQKNSFNIDSLRLYNINVSILDNYEYQEIYSVRVDQNDLDYLNFLLQKIKPKRIVFYKPASDFFYGLVCDSKDTYLRISKYVIYFSINKYHYIIDDKEDVEWLDYFFEKYQEKFKYL
jgi:hypothetical protein